MKRTLIPLLTLALLLACGTRSKPPAPSRKSGPVLARVGDETLTRDELMILFRGQVPPDVPRDRLQAALESWANGEVWYQEAARLGIGQDETTQLAIRNEEHGAIARMLLARIQDTITITDGDVYDYFTRHKDDFAVSASITSLMTYDSSLAVKISERIKSGTPFEQTAQEFSGEQVQFTEKTRYFLRDDSTMMLVQISPELNQAIFSLQKDQVSDVVRATVSGKTTFWVIKCLDRKRVKTDVKFEDVKQRIRAELLPFKQQAVADSITAQLKRKSKVEITPDNFYLPGAGGRAPAGK